jgi:hypothetical protein
MKGERMNTDNQNAVDLVRRGYDEDTRCLHFRVSFFGSSSFEDAIDAVEIIDSYNGFLWEDVDIALRKCKELIGHYFYIHIGRESSPVIYIEFWGMLDDVIKDQLTEIMKDAQADEVDWQKSNKREILRCWWD